MPFLLLLILFKISFIIIMSLNNLFYNKYFKYKNKYLEIKGGTIDENMIDMTKWKLIYNK
jgi:hypothetical protein